MQHPPAAPATVVDLPGTFGLWLRGIKTNGISVDYNSFLKRDYKSLVDMPGGRRPLAFSRLHVILVAAGALVIGTLLALASDDAAATRGEPATLLGAVTPRPATADGRLRLPLAVPPLPATPPAADPATDDTAAPDWQETRIRRGDTLSAIFKRLGIEQGAIHQLVKLGKPARILKRLQPGQRLRVRQAGGELQELVIRESELAAMRFHRVDGAFRAQRVVRELERRVAYGEATIESSLFEAGTTAGLSNSLIMELAGIFGWDIDFVLDIRRGDHFRLLYEEQFLDGKKVADGPILAAEFTNRGRTLRAIRYTDASGRSDYYDASGLSMRKAFLRTPVDFTRISSRFGRRHHPVLNRMRTHKGVDYAARAGTPIRAAGDGKIVFRGRKGGYGRAIIIQHGTRYSTLYAHMSAFNRKARKGRYVKQGQVIGYVGSSGLATGPHLHYEFRVNGVHRNPLTVRLPNARPIARKQKEAFRAHARRILAQLDMYTETRVATLSP